MGHLIGELLGTSSSPKTSSQSLTDTTDARTATDTTQAALLETAGGSEGDPLDPNNVSKRDSLYGN